MTIAQKWAQIAQPEFSSTKKQKEQEQEQQLQLQQIQQQSTQNRQLKANFKQGVLNSLTGASNGQ